MSENEREERMTAFNVMVGVLAFASLLELGLKVFWRAGVYLPRKGVIPYIYAALSGLQGVLFNFSVLLSFAALAAALYVAFRRGLRGRRLDAAVMISIALLLVASAVSLVLGPSDLFTLVYILVSALAVVLVAVSGVVAGEKIVEKGAVLLVALYYLCYRYYVAATVAQHLAHRSSEPFLAIQVLAAGELIAALSALAFFAAYAYPGSLKAVASRKIPLIVATLAALLFGVANAVSPAMTSVFAIWSIGFTVQFPILLYALSVWCFFFTVTECFLNKEKRYRVYALLLILAAGYTHKLTYQHLLALLGMIVLAHGKRLLPVKTA